MKSADALHTDEPRYLRPRQAARRYGVSPVTLWRMVKAGILPAPRKLGERVSLLDRAACDEAFERHLAGRTS